MKLGIFCFLALVAIIGAFYVFLVIRGDYDDED
jgi:hypothetical protein